MRRWRIALRYYTSASLFRRIGHYSLNVKALCRLKKLRKAPAIEGYNEKYHFSEPVQHALRQKMNLFLTPGQRFKNRPDWTNQVAPGQEEPYDT